MAAKECPNCRLLTPASALFCQCGYDFAAGGMRAPRPRPERGPRPPAAHPVAAADSEPASAPAASEPPPPFLQRVFAMPFAPSLWSQAAGWRAMQVVAPLLVLALLLVGSLAVYRGWGLRDAIRSAARQYDESYPAIIVENGKVRTEGDRVIRFVDRDSTFLVDPKATIALDQITTREYIVVREREIIRRQAYRTQVTKVAELQQVFGDPLRVDSASLRAFDARWGLILQIGAWAFLSFFILLGENICCLAYGSAAAGLAYAFRGRNAGHRYGACLRVALAAYSLLLVVGVVLNLFGKGPGFCFGLVLWPALLTGLTTWKVGR